MEPAHLEPTHRIYEYSYAGEVREVPGPFCRPSGNAQAKENDEPATPRRASAACQARHPCMFRAVLDRAHQLRVRGRDSGRGVWHGTWLMQTSKSPWNALPAVYFVDATINGVGWWTSGQLRASR